MAALPTRFKSRLPVDAPTKDLTHLKVEVFFDYGGINYATYKNERKGVYVSFQPMAVEKGEVFETERFAGFLGMKMLLEELPRMDRKKIKAHAEKVFPVIKDIAALWFARDFDGLRALLDAKPAIIERAAS